MKKHISFLIFAAAACVSCTVPFAITRAAAGQNAIAVPDDANRVLYMRVTAYTSLPDETDSTPFITAMGTEVHDGVVATNILPFGTKIQIPALFGDKIFTVEDRMNRRMKNVLDIWMPTKTKALRFGVNYTSIVIVGKNTGAPLQISQEETWNNAGQPLAEK